MNYRKILNARAQNASQTYYKILREIKRILGQVLDLPGLAARRLLINNIYHDYYLRKKNKVSKGVQSETEKIAIYLIYPTNGISDFHEKTLKELERNHYSTIIVSNLTLSDNDRIFLIKYSIKIIERVNFGYDFAGYREGILSSQAELKNCKKLFLINDSAIFPLQANSEWVQKAEKSGWELTASFSVNTYNYFPQDIRVALPKLRTNKKINSKFHYGSYAIILSEAIIKSKKFQKFFNKLILSNSKRRVIREGEIGLTQWAIKQGYSHGSLLKHQDLFDLINTLNNQALLEELGMAIANRGYTPSPEFFDKELKMLIQEYDSNSKLWRQSAINALHNFAAVSHPAYTLPHLLCTKAEYPFLKKAIYSASQQGKRVQEEILKIYGY